MQGIRRRKPDHRVIIQRARNAYRPEDISNDIISVQTTKEYDRAAGGFTIETSFKPAVDGKRYDEVIRPDDRVYIELDGGHGLGLHSVMAGLVNSSASRQQFDAEGRPYRRCIIRGMDFGKLLYKHQCVADIAPQIGKIGSESVVRLAQGVQFSGKPRDLVSSIFEKLFVDQVPWAAPYVKMAPTEGEEDTWQYYNLTILEATGSVWTAMKRAANEPFNALTTETRDGKLYVILEPFPFHPQSGKLTRETFHSIKSEEVALENLGISDHDRINYLYLRCDGVTLHNGSQAAPLQYTTTIRHDLDSIRLHGFRPWLPRTNFTPVGYKPQTNAGPDILEEVRARADALWARMQRNHEYLSGQMVINGRPEIKAGSGVVLEERNTEFFVEAVTHSYTWGRDFSTNLLLTRGQDHGRG